MRHLLSVAVLLVALCSFAQDTTVVSTLTFDSITTRRGWFEFPPATEQFRKVLMVHTLKCDPQTTQDQYDCGEWDYLTYQFVHEHTGVNDSTALTYPYFLVGTAAPESVVVSDTHPSNLHQRWERTASVVQVTNETTATVGANDAEDVSLFQGYVRRSQYLYTATELATAGLVAGPIHELRFHPVNVEGASMPRCVVRMKNTSSAALTRFEEGLVTVLDESLPLNGLQMVLTDPFVWDGTSNIVLDIAEEGVDDSYPATMNASFAPAGSALQEIGSDDAIETNNDFVGIEPGVLAGLSTAVTITFRTYGAPELPMNTTFLEAVGSNNQRILNIHLPWSNGRVYWDAGSNGGTYDRIDKAAIAANYQGQWNDWAFVKNTTTGSMKIYLNGALWHSATGKTLPMNGIVRMRVGSDANGGNAYPGLIDGLNIFSTELSAATIAAWHDRKTTPAHPDLASLLYSFEMEEGVFPGVPAVASAATAGENGWLMGTIKRIQGRATELYRNPTEVTVRPVVTFVQGDYTIAVDSVITAYPPTDFLPQLSREIFSVQGNSTVPTDTVFGYSAGWSYTYDPAGVAIDSVLNGGTLFLNDTLDYFGVPFEVINNHEIGRYITPYGIGLSLGAAGFSWVYDVTDYQYLLHDSVELSAGNQQELIDLKFLMIQGTPPRPVVNTQWPWGPMRSYSYASMSDNTSLASTTLDLATNAQQWMMRTRLTGHGDATSIQNVQGCCEFKDNTHSILANGTQVDSWHIWRTEDCSKNPVFPQGGTWIYGREGWCPGDVVRDRETEMTPYVQGNTLTVDYGITPVPVGNPGMGNGNYVTSIELVEYAAASHQLDAEIYDVLRPTDDRYRSRENPICYDPRITLRNAGAQPLTSVTFAYHVSGGQVTNYTWTGNLAHMEKLDVTLPINDQQFWAGDEAHDFFVEVTGLNGGDLDEYDANDHYRTHFVLPTIYPNNFVLYYKTNNRPQENDLFVRDIQGNVVFSRTTFTANTIYRDTLELSPGCYELEFTDTGDDGLSFWADTAAGTGYFRFRAVGGGTIRSFNADFGHSIKAAFAIGTITSVEERVSEVGISARPNPSDGQFTLSVHGVEGEAQLEVLDATGRFVRSETAWLSEGRTLPLDLTSEPNGVYLVRLVHENGTALLRLAKQ
ncbi:MAG: T9SS type A sorting domain-containing protein [Flavobacteriales bacterium]|nr:T9SS type A sorting domain-containing protein [Flavobacteriales bacterium]